MKHVLKGIPTASSTLTIGVAAAFIVLAGILGLTVDRVGPRPFADDWTLRGPVEALPTGAAASPRI